MTPLSFLKPSVPSRRPKPSTASMKPADQLRRRNSPSVTLGKPIDSWKATISRMASSCAALKPAASSLPALWLRAASIRRSGRTKLPMCSPWKGGFIVSVRRAEGADQQVHVAFCDAPEAQAGLAAEPECGRVAQAEQGERGEARVDVAAELSARDALVDDRLDQALVAPLDGADALARRLRQEAALAQEDDGVVEALLHRREMVEHQAGDLLRGA